MTDLVRCDGPGCSKTRETRSYRLLRDEQWISLTRPPDELDFCSVSCASSRLATL